MIRNGCQIIFNLDENHGKVLTNEQCVRANGICIAIVGNTVRTQTALFIDHLQENNVKVISVTEEIDNTNENDDLL